MSDKASALRARVRRFAVRVLRFVRTLPGDAAGQARSRSRAEFIAKLGVVVEEADEAEHWLGVIQDARLASGSELQWLCGESSELRAIFCASLKTARLNDVRRKRSPDGDNS